MSSISRNSRWTPSSLGDLTQEQLSSLWIASDSANYLVFKGKFPNTSKEPGSLEYDVLLTNIMPSMLGWSGHGVEIYIRDRTGEFLVMFQGPSGRFRSSDTTIDLLPTLSHIKSLGDLEILLKQISIPIFCSGLSNERSKLDYLRIYDQMSSWEKRSDSFLLNDRIFSTQCHRILDKSNLKPSHKGKRGPELTRCGPCHLVRKQLLNWNNRVQNRIRLNQAAVFQAPVEISSDDEPSVLQLVEDCAVIASQTPENPLLDPKLTYGASQFFLEQLDLHQKDALGVPRRYTKGFLSFCVLLKQITGREKYKRVRDLNFISLPDLKIIDRFFGVSKWETRPNLEALASAWQQFATLSELTETQQREGMKGWISSDEVDLREQASWRGNSIVGLIRSTQETASIDLTVPTQTLAGSAMLFIWRSSLFTQFRFPLCLFGVEQHQSEHTFTSHWSFVLSSFHHSDFTPLFLISDGAKGCIQARQNISADLNVGYYPDPPHVLKRVWKRIIGSRESPIWTQYGHISRTPFEIAVGRTEQVLSTAVRITQSCLDPNASESMSVRLALQLFSPRMVYLLQRVDHPDTNASIAFVKTMIAWWNVVSSTIPETQETFSSKVAELQQLRQEFQECKNASDRAKYFHKQSYASASKSTHGPPEKSNGIRSLLPDQFDDLIYICDFLSLHSHIGYRTVMNALGNQGQIVLNKMTQDINESYFSAMRNNSGSSRLVTLDRALDFVQKNQQQLPLLARDNAATDVAGASTHSNGNYTQKRHHSFSVISVLHTKNPKRQRTPAYQVLPEEAVCLQPSSHSWINLSLFQNQLEAGHNMIAAALRQIAFRNKLLVQNRLLSEESPPISEKQQTICELIFGASGVGSDDDDEFLPNSSSDSSPSLSSSLSNSPDSEKDHSCSETPSYDSPSSESADSDSSLSDARFTPFSTSLPFPISDMSGSDTPDLELTSEDAAVSASSSSQCFTETVAPARTDDRPLGCSQELWHSLKSETFTRLIAGDDASATRFSKLSKSLEVKRGSLILIKADAFTTFFIPLLKKIHCALFPQLPTCLRPVIVQLLCDDQLKQLFASLYSPADFPSSTITTSDLIDQAIDSMYRRIVEAVFRFFLGGDILPYLSQKVQNHLKNNRKHTSSKQKEDSCRKPVRQRLKNIYSNKRS